jgi:hypothetical protein
MISKEEYEQAQKIVKQYESEQLELSRIVNEDCRLGRFSKNCSIFLYTSPKDCATCGHFVKKQT